MVVGSDVARQMRADEVEAVDVLLRAAFPGPEEAALVRQLRADGAMVAEFVMGGAVDLAYAAISRMEAPEGWLCLAPVAVTPAAQGRRIGSRLVRLVVEAVRGGILPKAGDDLPTLVVLGEPSFYTRAGFSLERAARLTSPYPISHTLIARAGDDVPERQLIYPPAFGNV